MTKSNLRVFKPQTYKDKNYSLKGTVRVFINHCVGRLKIMRRMSYTKYEELCSELCKQKTLDELTKEEFIGLAAKLVEKGYVDEKYKITIEDGLKAIYNTYKNSYTNNASTPIGHAQLPFPPSINAIPLY